MQMVRFGCLGLLVLTGCVIRTGTGQQQPQQPPQQPFYGQQQYPQQYQQPIPPPQQYQQQPTYAYYNPAGPPPVTNVPPMPPALNIRDYVNIQHLQIAAAQPRRCDLPVEVAPGTFIHLDCNPYKRVAISTPHLSPSKLLSIKSGNFKWNPLTALGVQLPGFPTNSPQAIRADAALPDMVDHRLNSTEGPIKNQDQVGACTAFALSSTFDNSMRRASQNITTSPHHMWSHYAVPTMEDAAAANLLVGITTHEALPYSGKEACMMVKDASDDCSQAYNVRTNSVASDPALVAKLKQADATGGHKITSFEELQSPVNIDEVVAALATGADLWIAMRIDSSAFSNRRMNNFVISDWVIPDGGHAMTMAGYRKTNNQYQFLLHNSWGVSWGDKGFAWVSQAMVQRFMIMAYKIKTDVDPGGNTPVLPKTDEDCKADQVIDTVTKACATVCTDGSHPANGQCANGQPPSGGQNGGFPGFPTIPGLNIPGWPPQPQPQPNQPNQPNQPAQPTQPFPFPIPSNLPQLFPPPPPPTK